VAAHIIVHNPTESAKISKSEAGLLRRGASASRGLSDRGMDLEVTLARIRLSIPPTCSRSRRARIRCGGAILRSPASSARPRTRQGFVLRDLGSRDRSTVQADAVVIQKKFAAAYAVR